MGFHLLVGRLVETVPVAIRRFGGWRKMEPPPRPRLVLLPVAPRARLLRKRDSIVKSTCLKENKGKEGHFRSPHGVLREATLGQQVETLLLSWQSLPWLQFLRAVQDVKAKAIRVQWNASRPVIHWRRTRRDRNRGRRHTLFCPE